MSMSCFQFKLTAFASYKQECGLVAQISAGQRLLQSPAESGSGGSIDRNAGSQPTVTLTLARNLIGKGI